MLSHTFLAANGLRRHKNLLDIQSFEKIQISARICKVQTDQFNYPECFDEVLEKPVFDLKKRVLRPKGGEVRVNLS